MKNGNHWARTPPKFYAVLQYSTSFLAVRAEPNHNIIEILQWPDKGSLYSQGGGTSEMDKEKPHFDDLTMDGEMFRVLINDEGEHSFWPAGKAVPKGWTSVGPIGAKAECLAYVDAHWTDMRPRSLRKAMACDVTRG